MRDLEYEVARLETRLARARQAAPGAAGDDVPDLPVEVLAPPAVEVTAGDASISGQHPIAGSDEGRGDEFEVVGSDEDGVEIVYVGEAAEDRSVRPSTAYLRPRRPRPAVRAAARHAPATRRRAPSVTRRTSLTDKLDALDRIEVTDEIGPTVAKQLAAAGRVRARVSAERENLDSSRGVRPERPSVNSSVDSSAGSESVARKSAAKSEDKPDPKAEYGRYYQALRAGNHAFAITGFGHFIERYPRHSYADNALYWLAEAHYDQRDYQAALERFVRVERDYPRGNKVPDALLKSAFCHIALGDNARARAVLTQLIERYPRSKPAALAADRLASLAGE